MKVLDASSESSEKASDVNDDVNMNKASPQQEKNQVIKIRSEKHKSFMKVLDTSSESSEKASDVSSDVNMNEASIEQKRKRQLTVSRVITCSKKDYYCIFRL